MEKKLYRSQHNRVLLGVCGGLAEYFNSDPVLIRVIAVLIIVFTGGFPGLIAYFVMALIVPNEGSVTSNPGDSFRENLSDIKSRSEQMGEDIRTTFSNKATHTGSAEITHPVITPQSPHTSSNSGLFLVAIIIIAIGVFFLLENFFGWFWSRLWPIWLVIAGVIILIAVVSRRNK